MPQSRKRQGHHEFHKPSPVPASQRTKGRFTVAILFAVFGLIVGFLAAGSNIVVLAIASIAGFVLGYIIGKNMEAAAKN